MRLIVIATVADAPRPTLGSDWVLRLLGTPRRDEIPPPGLVQAAEEAAAQVRQSFPNWLWDWVSTNGALDLQVFPGPVSWWWYTPLSEKSPLRSPLIREIYWLILIRILLQRNAIEALEWVGNDRALAQAAFELTTQLGRRFSKRATYSGLPRHWSRTIARRIFDTVHHFLRWALLKAMGFGRRSDCWNAPEALLYTRFPVLWERGDTTWRERMFGTWPEYLQSKGHSIAYVAVFSGSVLMLARQGRQLRERCSQQDIHILEAALSLSDWMRAYLGLRLLRRYWFWRKLRRRSPVRCEGLNISTLFWRELDNNVLSCDIPMALFISRALRNVLYRCPSARAIFLPFEYQPMERAVWSGAKLSRSLPLVGVQTGLYTSNQMGFAFSPEETRTEPDQGLKSPLPDILAAYGELPYRVFAERLGIQRVCLSGPIRYPFLGQAGNLDVKTFRHTHGLPEKASFILVATSLAVEESLPLLKGAFTAASENPHFFLLFKFHYHLPLHVEVDKLAAQYHCQRYRVFDADLHHLMCLAPILLVPGSSTGIEAMTFNCMPLVFHSRVEMACNAMLEVPEAVFFWNSLDELRQALHACLEETADYQRRRAAWPRAIAAHLYRLDGQANSRLYQFLCDRGIF